VDTIHFPGSGDVPTMAELLNFPMPEGSVNLAQRIGASYMMVGILLLKDDDGSRMTSLEKEHMGRAESIIRAVFHHWLSGGGLQPVSWATLIGVLQDCDLTALAHHIQQGLEIQGN
jgi:hypothetical protein